MAFAKAYYFNYTSLNGFTYHLEIWQDNYQSTPKEGKLGKGGCKITYGSSDSELFATVKASTMEVPFVVGGYNAATDASMLRVWRTLAERKIYAHLYRESVTGTNDPIYSPIWSGYMLADIGGEKDEVDPYVVKLKFVDGLAALKMFDFVPTSVTQAPNHTYEKKDTYIPDPNNSEESWRNFKYWLWQILQYTGYATSSEGRVGTPLFSICNKFFNGLHTNTNQDPLTKTRCQAYMFYEVIEEDDEVLYKAKNCYQVLQAICKVWGMRVINWRGRFYFVQLSMYQINENGTRANPDDLDTYVYYLSNGNLMSLYDNIGTWWGRYDQQIHKGRQIQKLAGFNRTFLPKLKKVNADFIESSDYNYFQTFPLLPTTKPSSTGSWTTHTSIGIFKDLEGSSWYQEIWLNFVNPTNATFSFQVSAGLVARPAGSSTWTKMAYWDWSTPNPVFTWTTYAPWNFNSWQWPHIDGIITLPSGTSCQNICSASLLAPYVNFDTGSSNTFVGDWEIGYGLVGYRASNGSMFGHGYTYGPNGMGNAWDDGISYSNTTPNSGINSSLFAAVNNSSVGNSTTTVSVYSSTDDTSEVDVDNIWWGDTVGENVPSALQCYDGSAWQHSGFAGNWGYDTTTGNLSMTTLLCTEMMNHQGGFNCIDSGKLVVGIKERYYNDGGGNRPTYCTPFGRYRTFASGYDQARTWIMHSGTFTTADDEWNMTLYEYKYVNVATNSSTASTGGTNTGGVNQPSTGPPPSPGAKMANPNSNIKLAIKAEILRGQGITTTSTHIAYDPLDESSQTITSIPIEPLNVALLKTGDKISIKTLRIQKLMVDPDSEEESKIRNYQQSFTYQATIASDQSASDTTLTIESLTINNVIQGGSTITVDTEDLIQQYQRKTRGEIAGFTVDSDGLTKDGIEITGWLDSDTMEGASANTVPTSESVKAYVDSSSGGSATLQDITDNGNTTNNFIELNDGTGDSPKLKFISENEGSETTGSILMKSNGKMNFEIAGAARLKVQSNGDVDVTNDLDVSNNITVGGTVDGVDIAALNSTVADKQDAISLTTTGTSGAATFSDNTLNIPQYTGGSSSNYDFITCSGTVQTSASDGAAYAVVVPFDTEGTKGGAEASITSYPSEGKEGVEGSEYTFTMIAGDYEISWNVGTDTNVANNRILSGVKLQKGTVSGDAVEWADVDPSTSYIYDRGNGSIRRGSTSFSILYTKDDTEATELFRIVLWKVESSNASTTAITFTEGCSLFIKSI